MITTTTARRICKRYDIPTYSDENGDQIAERIDQQIMRLTAALEELTAAVTNYPGDAADVGAIRCRRCRLDVGLRTLSRHAAVS